MYPQVSSIAIGIDPIAFTIGSVEVKWWSIIFIIAVLVILLWLWRFGRGFGIKPEFAVGLVAVAVPVGLVVSRLVHVIDDLDYYTSHLASIIGLEGLTIFGGILGAALGAWIYCRMRGVPFAPLVDMAVPGVILAQAVGRIDYTINGCCGGEPTSLPWGFIYTHIDSQTSYLGVAVHPTQVYQILWNLIVFAILFWVLRGRLKPHGSLFVAYLALYSMGALSVRFFRSGTSFLGPLHEGQLISVLILAVTIPLLIVRTRWVKGNVEEEASDLKPV
jgi:phosphatidylglycerol:prolipoprotein diacylglycerol transferase